MLNSNFANRRNKISPIVGIKSRQSSEKFFANRRKTIVIFIFLVYNKYESIGNEVFLMKKYRKRIADDILKRKLEGKGAVLIEGPKWCGKTTTAEQLASSILYMDDPEKKRTKYIHV